METLSLADAGIAALLGYGVVFLGILFLLCVVAFMGKCFTAAAKRNAKAAPVEAAPAEPEPAPVAPGSAGQLKMHQVEPKTAAMLMAIVADKLGKPLNELRFISIKEVE